ncbi:MAG: transcription elongation factor GreA, transcription elongation factor GreA [Candidatus Wolfebacteria bacterium GW2011_GWC1_43_10]|nr:MAG: transcription elongation factor GreA, transcription elongation factor GreA [Candidatus Wolfebacteria bacterium GW2011_GWC1_43_10]
MGDRAKVKLPDGIVREFKLVYTKQINPEEGLISDESPVGRALLGAMVGEKRKYRVGDRELELEVLEIFPREEKKKINMD